MPTNAPHPHRRLPHPAPNSPNQWAFITWHLHGSLPHALYPPPHSPNAGRAFLWMDHHLDTTTEGPQYLKIPAVAESIQASIHRSVALGHFHLAAYVLMPNHVHLLLQPLRPLPRLLQSLKGASARQANQILHRSGSPFWQSESYDHWVRNPTSFHRIQNYIESNPVKANLAPTPESYPYSSAHQPNCGAGSQPAGSRLVSTSPQPTTTPPSDPPQTKT